MKRLPGRLWRTIRGGRTKTVVRSLPQRFGYGPGQRIMSWLRKRWLLLRHPGATIRFEGPCHLGPGFNLRIRDKGTFIVGQGVEFRRGFEAQIDGGRVIIGAGVSFNYGVALLCSTTIEIGIRSSFAPFVVVADGNHRYRDITRPVPAQGYDFRPIRIGDDVLVNSNSTVVESIGDHSVIGANAVVTKPIPAYTLAVGVPARVIDYFGPPGHEPAGFEARASADASD